MFRGPQRGEARLAGKHVLALEPFPRPCACDGGAVDTRAGEKAPKDWIHGCLHARAAPANFRRRISQLLSTSCRGMATKLEAPHLASGQNRLQNSAMRPRRPRATFPSAKARSPGSNAI